jgi:hypothetical protein
VQGARQRRMEQPAAAAAQRRVRTTAPPPEGFYSRLGTQRIIAVLVLAAAVGVQYYLVNMPVADLSQTTKFSPATVKATDQLVWFTSPETEAGRFTFIYDQPAESQKQNMLVNAYFDKASLSQETVHKLAALGVQAPSDATSVSYVTSTTHNGVCSTTVQVEASSSRETRVQFSQSEIAPTDRHRLLEVNIAGSDSTVLLSSGGPFSGNNASPCQVKLQAGSWEESTGGFVPIKIRVPSSSSFRFRWEASSIQPSGWPTRGPLLSLLTFGNTRRQSFHATAVQIVPAQAPASSSVHAGLVALSEAREMPLTVDSFVVGTDQLQFAASGKGRVVEDGKVLSTANLLDAINKYPLIAALFGAANLGLLNWAKRRFFPSRPVGPQSPSPR